MFELPQEDLSSVLNSVLIVEIAAALTDMPEYIQRVRECLSDAERVRFGKERSMNFIYTKVATQEGQRKIVEGAQALLREKISHGGAEEAERGVERGTELTHERIEALTFENMFDLSAEDLKRVVRNSRFTASGWGICAKGLDDERAQRILGSVNDKASFSARFQKMEAYDDREFIQKNREEAMKYAKEELLKLLSKSKI